MESESDLIDLGNGLFQIGNCLVEKDVLNIVDKIHDYDPELRVFFLDPDQAEFGDAPYQIAERNRVTGHYERIFEVWEMNDTVLERLWHADSTKHDIQALLEKNNERVRSDQERRFKEVREEAQDIMQHVFAREAGTYSFPGSDGQTVTLDSHLGVVKVEGQEVDPVERIRGD